MSGTLYLVPTPIGNLDDITLRCIKTLEIVDYICAEDTRHTLKLLNHLNISKPLISCYKENELVKADSIIDKLLDNKNIALVSDAGTPIISDPGEKLVKIALENDIKVVPLPRSMCINNWLNSFWNFCKRILFYRIFTCSKSRKNSQVVFII